MNQKKSGLSRRRARFVQLRFKMTVPVASWINSTANRSKAGTYFMRIAAVMIPAIGTSRPRAAFSCAEDRMATQCPFFSAAASYSTAKMMRLCSLSGSTGLKPFGAGRERATPYCSMSQRGHLRSHKRICGPCYGGIASSRGRCNASRIYPHQKIKLGHYWIFSRNSLIARRR